MILTEKELRKLKSGLKDAYIDEINSLLRAKIALGNRIDYLRYMLEEINYMNEEELCNINGYWNWLREKEQHVDT